MIALHDVLRVKGFLHRPGRDRRQVVQAVGSRVQQHFDRPWHTGEKRETRLVVIGKKGLDHLAIASALGAAVA
jgi:cobalamin biosynthesis protein CobW